MSEQRTLIVIPARAGSSRFPNKPMALIKQKTMIARVIELAKKVSQSETIIVATDSEEIEQEAKRCGVGVMQTPECPTGSDRVAYVAQKLVSQFDIVVSLQGDAPLIPPWVLDDLISAMQQDKTVQIATPAVRLEGSELISFTASKRAGRTTGTCVVFDKDFDALYFSKGLIPVTRGVADNEQQIYRHIGLYAYRPETLARFTKLEQTPLEQLERLEQLRALEHKIPIRVVVVDFKGRTLGSVDEPEDIPVIEAIIEREGEL